MEEVSKEEWEAWREHPVTRRVFRMISDRREEAIQYLAFGGSANSMSKQNITVGAINAYTHILSMRYQEEDNG